MLPSFYGRPFLVPDLLIHAAFHYDRNKPELASVAAEVATASRESLGRDARCRSGIHFRDNMVAHREMSDRRNDVYPWLRMGVPCR
jgi:hypothetical protein